MVLLFIISLLFDSVSVNFSEFEIIYRKYYDITEIPSEFTKRYSSFEEFHELSKLITHKKKYSYKNKEINLWLKANSAIFHLNKAPILELINYIDTDYSKSDKTFLQSYYSFILRFLTEDVTYNDFETYFEKNNTLKPEQKSFLLYAYRTKLLKTLNYSVDLVNTTHESMSVNQGISANLYAYDISTLHRITTFYGLFDVEYFFTNWVISNLTPKNIAIYQGILTDHFRANFPEDIQNNKKLYQQIPQTILSENLKNRLLYYCGENTEETELPLVSMFLNNSQLSNYYLNEGDISQAKHYYNKVSHLPTWESTLNKLILGIESCAPNPDVIKLDSIFNVSKEFERESSSQKIGSFYENASYFLHSFYSNYFQLKLTQNEYSILNDYLDIQHLRNYYENILKEKWLQDSLYDKYLNTKSNIYHDIEDNFTVDAFIRLLKIFILEKKKLQEEEIKPNTKTYQNIQQKLPQNKTLLIVINGSLRTTIVSIQNTAIKTFELGSFDRFIQNSKVYDEFIVVDPRHSFKRIFSNKFVKIHGVVPKVRYIDNLFNLETNELKSYPVSSATFYGTDKAFLYKEKKYSELPFVGNEIEHLSRLNMEDHLNTHDTIKTLTSDISHFSGHLIESDAHAVYNKIAVGMNDTVPLFYAAYDTYRDSVSSKLVFLNACKTGSQTYYDDFSAQSHFGKYFLNAGAKAVIITNRNIFDKVSVVFSEKFYDLLFAGNSVVESVQMAKTYLKDHINPDPKIWDSWHVYGEDFKVSVEAKFTFSPYWWVGFLFVVFFWYRRKTKPVNVHGL